MPNYKRTATATADQQGAKVPISRRIDTTPPLQGGGDLSEDRILSVDLSGTQIDLTAGSNITLAPNPITQAGFIALSPSIAITSATIGPPTSPGQTVLLQNIPLYADSVTGRHRYVTSGELTVGSGTSAGNPPGGGALDVQYNFGDGTFGGDHNFQWDPTNHAITVSGGTQISFIGAGGNSIVGVRIDELEVRLGNRARIGWQSGDAAHGTEDVTLSRRGAGQLGISGTVIAFGPMYQADPTSGAARYVVSAELSASAGTPGGDLGNVQYNAGGTFGGEDALRWDATGNVLTVSGTTQAVTLEVLDTATGSVDLILSASNPWSYAFPLGASGFKFVPVFGATFPVFEVDAAQNIFRGSAQIDRVLTVGNVNDIRSEYQQFAGSGFVVGPGQRNWAVNGAGGFQGDVIVNQNLAGDKLTVNSPTLFQSVDVQASGAVLVYGDERVAATLTVGSLLDSRGLNQRLMGSGLIGGLYNWQLVGAGNLSGDINLQQHVGTDNVSFIQIPVVFSQSDVQISGELLLYQPAYQGRTTSAQRYVTSGELVAGTVTAPGNPIRSVQFNSGGSFGGNANLTWTGTDLAISGGSRLIVVDGNSRSSIDLDPAGIRINTSGFLGFVQNFDATATANITSVWQGPGGALYIGDFSSGGPTVLLGTKGLLNLGNTTASGTLMLYGPLLTPLYQGAISGPQRYLTSGELLGIGLLTGPVYEGSVSSAQRLVTSGELAGLSPGAPSRSIQFNQNNAFAGDANLTWTGSRFVVSGGGRIIVTDANSRSVVDIESQGIRLNTSGTLSFIPDFDANLGVTPISLWLAQPNALYVGTFVGGAPSASFGVAGLLNLGVTTASGKMLAYGPSTFYGREDLPDAHFSGPLVGIAGGNPALVLSGNVSTLSVTIGPTPFQATQEAASFAVRNASQELVHIGPSLGINLANGLSLSWAVAGDAFTGTEGVSVTQSSPSQLQVLGNLLVGSIGQANGLQVSGGNILAYRDVIVRGKVAASGNVLGQSLIASDVPMPTGDDNTGSPGEVHLWSAGQPIAQITAAGLLLSSGMELGFNGLPGVNSAIDVQLLRLGHAALVINDPTQFPNRPGGLLIGALQVSGQTLLYGPAYQGQLAVPAQRYVTSGELGAATATPAGANTQVQFNSGGAFGADSGFIWQDPLNNLVVSGGPNAGVRAVGFVAAAGANLFQDTPTAGSFSTVNSAGKEQVLIGPNNAIVASGYTIFFGRDPSTAGATDTALLRDSRNTLRIGTNTAALGNLLLNNMQVSGTALAYQPMYQGQVGVSAQRYVTSGELAASAAVPGGASTQVQYNAAGVFGGDSGLTWQDGPNLLLISGTSAGLLTPGIVIGTAPQIGNIPTAGELDVLDGAGNVGVSVDVNGLHLGLSRGVTFSPDTSDTLNPDVSLTRKGVNALSVTAPATGLPTTLIAGDLQASGNVVSYGRFDEVHGQLTVGRGGQVFISDTNSPIQDLICSISINGDVNGVNSEPYPPTTTPLVVSGLHSQYAAVFMGGPVTYYNPAAFGLFGMFGTNASWRPGSPSTGAGSAFPFTDGTLFYGSGVSQFYWSFYSTPFFKASAPGAQLRIIDYTGHRLQLALSGANGFPIIVNERNDVRVFDTAAFGIVSRHVGFRAMPLTQSVNPWAFGSDGPTTPSYHYGPVIIGTSGISRPDALLHLVGSGVAVRPTLLISGGGFSLSYDPIYNSQLGGAYRYVSSGELAGLVAPPVAGIQYNASGTQTADAGLTWQWQRSPEILTVSGSILSYGGAQLGGDLQISGNEIGYGSRFQHGPMRLFDGGAVITNDDINVGDVTKVAGLLIDGRTAPIVVSGAWPTVKVIDLSGPVSYYTGNPFGLLNLIVHEATWSPATLTTSPGGGITTIADVPIFLGSGVFPAYTSINAKPTFRAARAGAALSITAFSPFVSQLTLSGANGIGLSVGGRNDFTVIDATGFGTVTRHVGYRVEPLVRSTNPWAFGSDGPSTPSYHAGPFIIGASGVNRPDAMLHVIGSGSALIGTPTVLISGGGFSLTYDPIYNQQLTGPQRYVVSGEFQAAVASVNTTGLTNNVSSTQLYAVSGAAMFRVSSYVVETTAASATSTLPNVQILYTDRDTGGSITLDATPILGIAGIGQTGALTANTIGTASAGVICINAKASTAINYQTVNYASSLAGMAYALRIRLDNLG